MHLSIGCGWRNSASYLGPDEGLSLNDADSSLHAKQNTTSSIATSPVRPYDVNSSICIHFPALISATRYPAVPVSTVRLSTSLHTRGDRRLSVARKLFGPDIVFTYSPITESLDHRRHHLGWSRYVIDGTSHVSYLGQGISNLICPVLPLHDGPGLVVLVRVGTKRNRGFSRSSCQR